MPIQREYIYIDPAIFTYDNTVIDVGVGAKLLTELVENNTFDQDFTSSAGFSYDTGKTSIGGGTLTQIDTTPAESTFAATYTTVTDGSWGDSSLTSTVAGGAAIVSSSLDLTGYSGKTCTYAISGALNPTRGAIRFIYTPLYTGAPASEVILFNYQNTPGTTTAAISNRMTLRHEVSNAWRMDVRTSSGGVGITGQGFGSGMLVAGTDYEIEFNWDTSTGDNRFFINGTQQGATPVWGFVRDDDFTTVNHLALGEQGALIGANASYRDLLVFDQVQHTADYTPGYSIEETKYLPDLVTVPLDTNPAGVLNTFTDYTTSGSSDLLYTLNDLYYDGADWVASNNTQAQMNTSAGIQANILTLPAQDTLQLKVLTEASNTPQVLNSTQVVYSADRYPLTSPSITNNVPASTDGVLTFTATVDEPANTSVSYIIVVDGVDMYFDGAAWAVSDGELLQSNTQVEVNTNAPALTLSPFGSEVAIKALLNSVDGDATPTLLVSTITYDFSPGPAIPPTLTIVYGWLCDPTSARKEGLTVSFTTPTTIAAASLELVKTTKAEVVTDAEGYFEVEIIPGKYKVALGSLDSATTLVPSAESVNINTIFNNTY